MRLRTVALAALTGFALSCIPVPALAQKPRAERPTYAPGEKWIRTDGVYELIRIENGLYVFAASNNRQIFLTQDLMFARRQQGFGYVEFDPPPKLAWPLEVGKSGTSWGNWRWSNPNAGRNELPRGDFYTKFMWTVEAYEDVEVVAGRFKAFKIRFVLESRRPYDPGRTTMTTAYLTLWYAPEARQIVRMSGTLVNGHSWDAASMELAAVDRPAPLEIILAEPKDGARLVTESVTLTAKATSGKGLARVAVSLNGQEIPLPGGAPADAKERALSANLKLKEGKNVLLVTATETGGEMRQEARVLFYDKPAPSPTPPPVVAAPPKPEPPVPVAPKPEPPVVAKPTPPPVVVEKSTPAPPPPVVAALPPLPPLELRIGAPAEQTRVQYDSVALAALVSGGKGSRRVVVTLNGLEVTHLDGPAATRVVPVNLPVKLREGQNTLVVTATDAEGATLQDVRTVLYEKITPLAIVFRYPENGARLTEPTTVVVATANSSNGIARVSVTLNSVDLADAAERPASRDVAVAARPAAIMAQRGVQKSVALTVPVTLREGNNVIVVTATEADGTSTQAVRTVAYNAPKVAAAPPPPAVELPERWAVVIGVGNYEHPAISKLQYTINDAEALYQVLIGPGGFKKERVLLLTDRTERKPTLRNIKWALGTFLSRSAKKDDMVLIFFAGHGAPEVDPRGIERDGLSKYLVPIDADPDDLYSTALPMDDLQTIFGRIEAERAVIFLDSCYSGAAGGRTFAAKKTRATSVDDVFLDRLTRSKGRAIITASRPSEVSVELPDLKHGIFTYYLVEGLKGAADLNRDGIVTLQELYEYVEREVGAKSRAVGGNQHPLMKGELEGLLPLVKVQRR
ncbi:MAG TPA: caspase family protein [Methylomirabilota bacterium]|nr:caspase family protein [Methylomirabilota bacterium]